MTTPINQSARLVSSLCALVALVFSASLQAQTTTQVYDAATVAKYDKNANGILDASEIVTLQNEQSGASTAITMSPFEVSTDRDKGFRSSSVGSGARLKVDLAETPVAYSVINREFMDALGIADMRGAIEWSTSSTYFETDNGSSSFGRPAEVQVRGNTVSIGSSADAFGGNRNFYQNANSSQDSFSVETFDFGRGPNAALFGQSNAGTGGLGGVQSAQTKQARFDRTEVQVALTYDQFESHRVMVDINRPINERIGLRINAVHSDTQHWRAIDRQQTKGLALNLKYKISPTTDLTIDGNHEWHTTHNVGGAMDDYVSGWDGMTVFRGPITNAMFSTNGTLGATTSTQSSSFIPGGSQVFGVGPVNNAVGLTFSGDPQGVTRVSGANFGTVSV